jgi:ArsR family transcriptional regulator
MANPIDFLHEMKAKSEIIEQTSRSMKAIAHPMRLKILCIIGDQEASVLEIVTSVGTSQSNISQHLAIMWHKNVLKKRKEANKVYYRIADARVLQLIKMMRDVFCNY